MCGTRTAYFTVIAVYIPLDVFLTLTGSTLTILSAAACGQWTQDKLQKSVVGQHLTVSLNPQSKMEDGKAHWQFISYLSCLIKVSIPNQCLHIHSSLWSYANSPDVICSAV